MRVKKVTEPEIVDVLVGGADPALEERVRDAVDQDPAAAALHADWTGLVTFIQSEMAPVRRLSARVRGGVAEQLRAERSAHGTLRLTPEDARLAAAYLARLRRRRFNRLFGVCAAALLGFFLMINLHQESGTPNREAALSLARTITTLSTAGGDHRQAVYPAAQTVGADLVNTASRASRRYSREKVIALADEKDQFGRAPLIASNSSSFYAYPAENGMPVSRTVALHIPTRSDTLGVQPSLVIQSPPAADLAQERAARPTRLLTRGPSPQAWKKEIPPPGVREIRYPSGELSLMAWISDIPADGRLRPGVVYVHGGFSFERADWDVTAPYLKAGFVVLTPTLRGENGNPGCFEAYFGEVDDVIAAGRHLAAQPGVDPERVYVSGHSVGGVLTILAAMMPSPFAGAAAFGGAPDPGLLFHGNWRSEAPFDPADPVERRLRTPRAFAGSVRCPLLLVAGQDDGELLIQSRLLAQEARQAGRSVQLQVTPGNHFSSLDQAVQLSLQAFVKP